MCFLAIASGVYCIGLYRLRSLGSRALGMEWVRTFEGGEWGFLLFGWGVACLEVRPPGCCLNGGGIEKVCPVTCRGSGSQSQQGVVCLTVLRSDGCSHPRSVSRQKSLLFVDALGIEPRYHDFPRGVLDRERHLSHP